MKLTLRLFLALTFQFLAVKLAYDACSWEGAVGAGAFGIVALLEAAWFGMEGRS